MTSFNGRRSVNISQFLANGNAITPANDVATEAEDFNFDDDLARFTNVDFTDFDSGNIFGAEGSLEFNAGQDESAKRQKVEGQVEDNQVPGFVN
ncbi:MAG: hypothetical protein Q9164_006577, partial [Protoblastenia rupestris]